MAPVRFILFLSFILMSCASTGTDQIAGPPGKPNASNKAYDQGVAHNQNGLWREAKEAFTRALEQDPMIYVSVKNWASSRLNSVRTKKRSKRLRQPPQMTPKILKLTSSSRKLTVDKTLTQKRSIVTRWRSNPNLKTSVCSSHSPGPILCKETLQKV